MPAVISDTSCLVFLGKMGKLDVLPSLFGEVWLTPAVAADTGCHYLPGCVYSRPVPCQLPGNTRALRRGRAGFMGLALAHHDCLLIIDDEQPKQLAKALGIKCIGTLGVLKLVKEAGLLDQMRPVIQQLRETAGMWLTDAVAEQVCHAAGE